MERRRRGGSIPELDRLYLRLTISTMLIARYVLCNRSREREAWARRPTPSFLLVGLWVEVDFFPVGLSFFFIYVEVAALCFERGLGLLPCYLVPWCRLGLRPLLGTELFAVVNGGAVGAAASPPPLRFRNLPLRGACLLVLLQMHRALL